MMITLSEEPKRGIREITALLRDWEEGDGQTINRIIPLVYNELRRMARYYLQAGTAGHSLQATALVHEVYQCLAGDKILVFNDRDHFFRCSRLIMRQTLTKHARMRHALKRGNGQKLLDFNEDSICFAGQKLAPETLLDLDKALNRLLQVDVMKHQIVELRFYMGLTTEEISAVLEISPRTVRRSWQTAQSWLAKELGKHEK